MLLASFENKQIKRQHGHNHDSERAPQPDIPDRHHDVTLATQRCRQLSKKTSTDSQAAVYTIRHSTRVRGMPPTPAAYIPPAPRASRRGWQGPGSQAQKRPVSEDTGLLALFARTGALLIGKVSLASPHYTQSTVSRRPCVRAAC